MQLPRNGEINPCQKRFAPVIPPELHLLGSSDVATDDRLLAVGFRKNISSVFLLRPQAQQCALEAETGGAQPGP